MPKEGISGLGHFDILSYEEILRIAQVAVKKGISKIRLTGGEPLIRKNLIFFMDSLTRLQGIEDLSLTTNGVLLNEYAASLWSSGLRRLNISMDSLIPENYRRITRGGELALLWKGIHKSLSIGFHPIKINVVAIKGFNDNEILDFAKLTLSFPFEVRFIELMPIGNPSWSKEDFIPSKEIKEIIESAFPVIALDTGRTNGPAQIYKIEGALGQIGIISPMSDHFCDYCNRLRVTADGKLRTCLFSDSEIDLKTPLRSGCSDEKLEALIEEGIMKKPRRHGLKEDLLKKCFRPMSTIGG
jgi:cyclic pyranopterin phosphate synthase